MKKNYLWPIFFLIGIFVLIFREVILYGQIPISSDILVGAYYPWLDYKWGYTVGVPVKNALLSDPFSHFFIFKHLVASFISHRQWPLWNPYILSGTPLLASFHTNPFFFANFFLLLPRYLGWRLFIALSSLFAALTMFAYLKSRFKSTLACIFGAIVFSMSGLMTTWLEIGTAVWAMSLIPLLFLSIDQFILNKQKIFLIIFPFLISMLIFAGNVQIITYFLFILMVYTFLLFYHQKIPLTKLMTLFVFGLLGLALTLVQLLPTYELFKNSIRGAENFASSFNYGLVKIPQLIRLWIADFFGNPSTHNHWGEFEYHEYSSFLGTLTLPLVISILFIKKKSKYLLFFTITFLLSLFLVTLNPLSRYVFSLPIPLLTFSLASRLFFVTIFSAAILVTYSIEYYFVHSSPKKNISLVSLLFICLTLGAIYFAPLNYRSVALRNSLFPLVILLFLFFISLFKSKYIIFKNLILISLVFLICFDLGRYLRKYNPFIDQQLVYPSTPIIEYLQNQPGVFRIAREQTNLLPPNSWAYYNLESVEGYEPLRPQNYSQLFHLLENKKYNNQANRFSELEDINPKFLDALNVKYFVIANQKEPTLIQQKLFKADYKVVFTDKSVSVLKNPNASPRAYFATQVVNVDTEDELTQKLESTEFIPSKTALIFESLNQPSQLPTTKPNIEKYSANQIIIKTSDSNDQFLILANNYDAGWQATIDGKKQPLYRVNGALQGVSVPAGDHQLVFTYLPKSLVLGFKLSLISLFLLVALSIMILIKHERSTP